MNCANKDIQGEVLMRKLQYRLKRQGVLELDAWLLPLHQALQLGNPDVIQAVEMLLNYENPELLSILSGKKNMPEELKPWLDM